MNQSLIDIIDEAIKINARPMPFDEFVEKLIMLGILRIMRDGDLNNEDMGNLKLLVSNYIFKSKKQSTPAVTIWHLRARKGDYD